MNEKTPFFFSSKEKEEALATAEKTAGFDLDSVAPEKSAPGIKARTLVVHGTQDTFIPMSHALRIYDALTAPKELVRLEGVSHMDVLLHPEAWHAIARFLATP